MIRHMRVACGIKLPFRIIHMLFRKLDNVMDIVLLWIVKWKSTASMDTNAFLDIINSQKVILNVNKNCSFHFYFYFSLFFKFQAKDIVNYIMPQ